MATTIIRPTTGTKVTFGSLSWGAFFTSNGVLWLKIGNYSAFPFNEKFGVLTLNSEDWVQVEKVEIKVL